MREVSDDLLFNVAEVSGTLVGLFLIGVLFYVESGMRRWGPARPVFEPYLRAGTRIVLLLFAVPLFLSLTLVALGPGWGRWVFVLLSLLLIAANVDTLRRLRGLWGATGSVALVANELASTAVLAVVLVLPWALGGFAPTREDLTWAILLSLAAGFLSICAVVLSIFDVPRDGPDG